VRDHIAVSFSFLAGAGPGKVQVVVVAAFVARIDAVVQLMPDQEPDIRYKLVVQEKR
jgi:hypothetical protein